MSRFVRYLSFTPSAIDGNLYQRIYLTRMDVRLHPKISLEPRWPKWKYLIPRYMIDTATLKINGSDIDMSRKNKLWWYRYFSQMDSKSTEMFTMGKRGNRYYLEFKINR